MALNYQLLNNPRVESSEISKFLRSYQQHQKSSFPTALNHVFIHPNVVSFPTSANRVNRGDGSNVNDYRETYSEFWRTKHGDDKCTTVVGLFSTWLETWVGKKAGEWMDGNWHCWGVAVMKNPEGYGKHLLIWDCNAGNRPLDLTAIRPHQFMLGTQVKLIQYAKAQGKIDGVWYGGTMNVGEDDQCVHLTMEWIRSMAGMEDVGFVEEKVTALGFRRVVRS
ncbi:hypothetical protein MMC24_002789 [Lignoscripta atroalba]|nr:hypothetical protein [Lignoscripta atroalba]